MKKNGLILMFASFFVVYLVSLMKFSSFIEFFLIALIFIIAWMNLEYILNFISKLKNVWFLTFFILFMNCLFITIAAWSKFKITKLTHDLSITTKSEHVEKLPLLIEKLTVVNSISSFIGIFTFLFLVVLIIKLLDLRKSVIS
ncbi:hypothetical protein [Paenibacillus sp. Y412MC10]|uniref:hypothetical protein n=1 Tax=Geobacillus sp. (strain Y412MC10) TaxID=481743 RepID=UPI0011A06CA8|nr:hypothetical protein [Paenibacillus sp. Y412MC10]